MKLRMPKLDEKKKMRILVVSDANWGREKNTKSQGGFWIFLAEDRDSNNGPITAVPLAWKSWTLRRVAVSTLHAEAQAALDAVSHAVHVAGLVRWAWGLTEEQLPIDLRTDCESLVGAIATTKTLHDPRINVQVQSIREDVQEGTIRNVRHVVGKTNPADISTKQNDLRIRSIVHRIMSTGKVQDLK